MPLIPEVGRTPNGGIWAVRRQIFLSIIANYFPRSTTFPSYLLGGAERPPPGGGRSPPAARFLSLRSIYIRGGGKVGNLLLVFHFSIRPRRRSCGNVGIAPPFGGLSKGPRKPGPRWTRSRERPRFWWNRAPARPMPR